MPMDFAISGGKERCRGSDWYISGITRHMPRIVNVPIKLHTSNAKTSLIAVSAGLVGVPAATFAPIAPVDAGEMETDSSVTISSSMTMYMEASPPHEPFGKRFQNFVNFD